MPSTIQFMEINGHIQNGVVVPDAALSLPDGAKVIIVVPPSIPNGERLTPEELTRQREALARIDAVANENPGDTFSGADHDRALYGDRE